ncbi:Glutamate receptor ionotropic, NMDA 3B, partial [Frankliniella fusca]
MFARPPTAILLRNDTLLTYETRQPLQRAIGYFGMDAWILKLFAEKYNFRPMVFGTTDNRTFGYNVNGTYTGTVRDLVSGYSDIAFNQHFILDYNSQDVLPSGPVDYDALCVVVPPGEVLSKWELMLQSFGYKLVLVFCVLSFMLVAFFWVLSINAPRRPTCNDSFFFMYAMLCGAPVVPQPKVCSQRMLIGCCAIFGVLATNSLQSQMVTMLSRARPPSQLIRTLKQLDESGMVIITGSDSLTTTTFQGDNPLLQRLLAKVITPYNMTEYYRMLQSGEVARLNRRNSMKATELDYLLPECPREYFLGYLLPQCSPFLEPLNRLLSLLHANGLLSFFKDKSYFDYHRRNLGGLWAQGDTIRVKLGDMYGPFCMLFAGHFTAFGALLGEQAVHRATAYLGRLLRDWRSRPAPARRGAGRRPGL